VKGNERNLNALDVKFSQGWLCRVQPSGTCHALLGKFTDVLEGYTASIFRAEE
jgi:hypothetical protein